MNPFTWDAPFAAVYAGLFVIVTLRASATYILGRGVAAGVQHSRFAERMQGARYQQAVNLVSRYGAPVVSLCFLTVGFQTIVLLATGALRMPLRRFIPALAVGGALWALLYSTVGFVGFELIAMAYRFSPPLTIGVLVAVVATIVGHAYYRHRSAKRTAAIVDVPTDAPAEQPQEG